MHHNAFGMVILTRSNRVVHLLCGSPSVAAELPLDREMILAGAVVSSLTRRYPQQSFGSNPPAEYIEF